MNTSPIRSGELLARARDFICPLDPILERIPYGATHLDIGCGRGVLLVAAAAERNTHSVGCEPSASAVAAAERLSAGLAATTNRRPPRVIHASTPDQWPTELFDVVTMIDVLHHMPIADQAKLLGAAAARVRPNGLLVFKDIALRPHWKRMMNTLHDLLMARQLVHYMPLEHVMSLLCLHGLEPLETLRYDVLWYAHELAVMRRRPV